MNRKEIPFDTFPSNEGRWNWTYWILGGVVVVVIAIGMLIGLLINSSSVASEKGEVASEESKDRAAPSKEVIEKAKDYELSPVAKRVSGLLDRKAYEAAEAILTTKLLLAPDDAGLSLQYARLLILTTPPHHSGFVRDPLKPGKTYWASSVARMALDRAIQLNPECKSYLACVILEALRDRSRAVLAKKEGLVGHGQIFGTNEGLKRLNGFQVSTLSLAWVARKADPEATRAYAADFRELTEMAVKAGKVTSAAMLGNLTGDLEQGKVEGDRDFELACDGFARALENYKKNKFDDWIAETVRLFRDDLFRPELKNVATGEAPEAYRRLQAELKKRGYSLEPKN